MDDDRPFLEKQKGHKPYGYVSKPGQNRNLASFDCYSEWFDLYLAVGTKLIQ